MKTELAPLRAACPPRWLSICLLIAVLFLPLHFHVTSAIASQITKECICLHGSRTHANPAAISVACAPAIIVYTFALVTQVEFDSQSVRIPSSRAPPHLVSL